MMEKEKILEILNEHYPVCFDSLEFVRDSGSMAYAVFSGRDKYFLRITKPAFFDTVHKSLEIHVFLMKQGFSVPPVIFTRDGSPCVHTSEEDGEHLYILYEFIEGKEVDPEQDAEAIGALLGKFHSAMKAYPGTLVKRDKYFYIGRYIDILREKKYPRAEEFAAYGEALWEKIRGLPTGYCHGDMYRGNIHKAGDGRLYILDFDTSCEGFPMYDPVLICNMTDYFELQENGYEKSREVFARFLPAYLKYSDLMPEEEAAFYDLIALYHFALQATIVEVFGMDCVDEELFDCQLEWLYKWREQCEKYEWN